MAKRRNRNFVAIPFSVALSLSTLADDTVLSAGIITCGEDLYLISVDSTWHIRGIAAGEQPLECGFAHGDLTDAEIGEALGAELSDPDDIIARERARRPVRRTGNAVGLTGDTDLTVANGEMVRTKCKFSVGDTHTVDLWVANRSGAALAGGAVAEVNGVLYGRWQR